MHGIYFVIRKAAFATPLVEATVQRDTFSTIPLPVGVSDGSEWAWRSEESGCPAGDVPWEGMGGPSSGFQSRRLK